MPETIEAKPSKGKAKISWETETELTKLRLCGYAFRVKVMS
ncbi:hypothetical protein VCRA2117O380_30302 [Vibrio crassostreae]|nr:hypothetical protein VCRA2117O379_30302 [Vibrio crassostreae]CAK2066506.1 hypothetical protein VCRA2119O382_30302 [Vibrio crassostreae]CAK2069407.1 hypothetical protein VCRA2117O380_30302 [Vibrio crassostreae]CAK2508041.1 hypothetical protein VCRA2113O360_40150 [Vibrio crassostreae]CAK3969455.1 hypothetical protein VCRA2130O400_460023 [Vibrio crassostreae]